MARRGRTALFSSSEQLCSNVVEPAATICSYYVQVYVASLVDVSLTVIARMLLFEQRVVSIAQAFVSRRKNAVAEELMK